MSKNYLIVILITTFFLIPFLFAYYKDYKSNPKEFNLGMKGVAKILMLVILYFSINKVYRILIPFNKNTGIEFNVERQKIGLPILDKNWKLEKSEDEQFKTTYWKLPSPKKGHFKKSIEYGILGANYETDYYKNDNFKQTFVWSIYDFEDCKVDYFLEKPNENVVSINDRGNLVEGKPSTVFKINKEQFNKFISE